jgi:hypothetical protein
MTLQMVEFWHRTDTIPRLRGPSLERWREKDNNNPAPSYEEFDDGSVQFYNGVNGRPCRNLCEFEKDLLKEYYHQYNMPEEAGYAPFKLSDAHWQTPGTRFQIPGAQFQGPDAHFEIPSFIELEIWCQKLDTPGLEAWEAFVKARQTKAQKEERDASIKAWMKLMHDMFWHKERHCRCKGKKKGISGRDSLTPSEKFQEMVKDMVFGVRWEILKMKFETLPENERVEEDFIAGPDSEQPNNQYAYFEETNASKNKLFEEYGPVGSTSKSIETRLRAIEDDKLWEIFKMAEKRIKWPRSNAELHEWGGAEAELRKSILDSGHTEFLKNVSREGFHLHDCELIEDEAKFLNDQSQPSMSIKPPCTPRGYRRKPKKDAATRAAEVKVAKARTHSFIKFFLKNPQMNNAAEDEFINNFLQKTPRKRYAPRRMTDVQVDNSDPWDAQEEFIQRILVRSKSKKEAKAQAQVPDSEVAEDSDIKGWPSKKINIHLTSKQPSDEQIQQKGNEEDLEASDNKSKSRKRKSPQKFAGAEDENGEGDEEMMASPAKKPRVRARKTAKKAVSTLDNAADAQNENAETLNEIIAMTHSPGKKEPDCSDLAIQPMSDRITDYVDRKLDSALLSTSVHETTNQTTATSMNPEAAENASMNAADDTPSKLLVLAGLAIEQQGTQEMMAAPVKTPKTPAKRKSRAKKPAQTPNESALEDTPSKQLKIGSLTIEADVEKIATPVKAPKTPAKRKSRAKKPAATPTQADSIASPETPNIAKTPIKNSTNDTPSKQLKLGSMTLEDRENEEMMDAPTKTPTTPAKRKNSAKNAATATATPKRRKTPVKMGAVNESPTKKPKTTHTKGNMRELDEFYNLIDPLLR